MKTRTEELCDIAKAAGGIELICKNIVDNGTTAITESEFSAALMEHAKSHRRGDESVVKAFSRMIETDADIRCAYGITKGYPNMMSVEPVSVEVGATNVESDAAKAYDKLTAMAEEQRRRSPTLTVAQAFARVFEDQANSALAAKAHRRPSATASHTFPKVI